MNKILPRLIKFKFIDKSGGSLVRPSEMEFTSDPDGDPFIGLAFNLYNKDIRYLQFSGLMSKDGQEVYEGDRVKYTRLGIMYQRQQEFIGTVVFRGNKFCLQYDNYDPNQRPPLPFIDLAPDLAMIELMK